MADLNLEQLFREVIHLDDTVMAAPVTVSIEEARQYVARYLNLPDLSQYEDGEGNLTDPSVMKAVVYIAAQDFDNGTDPNVRGLAQAAERVLNMMKEELP